MDHQTCPLASSNVLLLKSGQYSDLTIRCGGNEHLLHRAIVCPRSDFLAIACDGRFKEGASGVIALPDDDPTTFARMVQYLYTLKYDDDSEEDPNPFTKASANALVYAMADKYNVADLATLAAAKFGRIVSELSDECLPAVIEIIVTTTPPSRKGLRALIFAECVGRMRTLVQDEAFIRLLGEHAEVGSALALKGYETMRAGLDTVELQLSEARKTVKDRDEKLRFAKNVIASLERELEEAKGKIAGRDGGYSTRGGVGREFRTMGI